VAIPDEIVRSEYVSLTTFRRDGTPVATPVWHVVDDDDLVVISEAESWKVKRIRNNARVVVTVCDLRGRIKPGAATADGTARLLDAPPDLLLGVIQDSARTERVAVLDRGSTVLLYTDGLVERRGQSLDEGLARLQETLAVLAGEGLSLETLCDRLLEHLPLTSREDDVALVAVRLSVS